MRVLLMIFWVPLLLSGCGASSDNKISPPPIVKPKHSERLQQQMEDLVADNLTEPLWNETNAYDSSASLMFPMHYVFRYPERFDADVITPKSFDEFFKSVFLEYEPASDTAFVRRSQFSYFITEYLVLASDEGFEYQWQQELFEKMLIELQDVWLNRPATHWSQEFNGVKDRILWKLAKNATDYEFYNAIVDEDWFVLAALSDLAFVAEQLGQMPPEYATDLKDISLRMIEQEGTYVGEQWYFQKGVWSDHRDYRYAGHQQLAENLQPKMVENIAVDASHHHRIPLWIKSFQRLQDHQVFELALSGFRETFEQETLDLDKNFIRMNNYMDGNNGLFRYGYITQGESLGYGPYQLSGTLYIGYYIFMNSIVYQQSMQSMGNQFPLSPQALDTYVGPNTIRLRHPDFAWPAYFQNGFAELFAGLASCWNRSLSECE